MKITRIHSTPERKAKLIVFLNMLTLIGGVITIVLLLRVIGAAARQNADTNNRIVLSQKQTEKELSCLASFFSQQNRQTLVITNLEHCTVTHTDTGQTEELKLVPVSLNQSSPAVPSSDTKQNSTTIPTSTQSNSIQTPTANTTALSQSASQAKAQASTDTKATIAPPKKLLGISLCVPFTGACIR